MQHKADIEAVRAGPDSDGPAIFYLAGLFDSGGSIGTFGITRPRFTMEIGAKEPVIDWLVANFGGRKVIKPPNKFRWKLRDKPAYNLYIRLKTILLTRNNM